MVSLGLVDEEGDLLELEVEEPILLVHGVASEVVAEDDVPVGTVGCVEELLQILGDLPKGRATCRPSFSRANFKSFSCFLISRMTA